MTRNGVEHDLTKTPYIFDTCNWKFYFSSEYYRNLFIAKRDKFIDDYDKRVYKFLGYNISCPTIAELKCYLSVEKRGCRAYYKPLFQFLDKEWKIIID